MLYTSNGKIYREVVLTEDQLRALVMAPTRLPPVGDDQLRALVMARVALLHHLEGPHDGIYDALQDAIDEGLTFRRDHVRLWMPDGTAVSLTVSPDGDVDSEGRPVDCTTVCAVWIVDHQKVYFEVDDEHEIIDQWRRQ